VQYIATKSPLPIVYRYVPYLDLMSPDRSRSLKIAFVCFQSVRVYQGLSRPPGYDCDSGSRGFKSHQPPQSNPSVPFPFSIRTMTDFEPTSNYSSFKKTVREQLRYVYDTRTNRFLNAIRETSDKRRILRPAGTVLWRAQRGCVKLPRKHPIPQWDDDFNYLFTPYDETRMFPLADRTREGRVNPKGIPCLYLATDKETAMSEVRPWKYSRISVASFVTAKDMFIVDCTFPTQRATPPVRFPTEQELMESYCWLQIASAFSEPVSATDDIADYAPTQVLADLFRLNGIDGILYKSELGEGNNVALFDIHSARVKDRFLYMVDSIQFAFHELPEDLQKEI
jgi:hypothetical protein